MEEVVTAFTAVVGYWDCAWCGIGSWFKEEE